MRQPKIIYCALGGPEHHAKPVYRWHTKGGWIYTCPEHTPERVSVLEWNGHKWTKVVLGNSIKSIS